MRTVAWRQVATASLAFLLAALLTQRAWSALNATRTAGELDTVGSWLKGRVIIVDPGHGGDDPGGVVGSTKEKELVLEISRLLKAMMEPYGAKIILTRDADIDLGGRMREELGKRVALVTQHAAHLYVSIHANMDRCYCWGAQTFYQKGGMPAGQKLAKAIQDQLRRQTPTTRNPLPANYFVLRTAPVPATMVEVGFLTNAKEHERLKDPSYQRTLAKAIAMGIADFYKAQAAEPDPESEPGLSEE